MILAKDTDFLVKYLDFQDEILLVQRVNEIVDASYVDHLAEEHVSKALALRILRNPEAAIYAAMLNIQHLVLANFLDEVNDGFPIDSVIAKFNISPEDLYESYLFENGNFASRDYIRWAVKTLHEAGEFNEESILRLVSLATYKGITKAHNNKFFVLTNENPMDEKIAISYVENTVRAILEVPFNNLTCTKLLKLVADDTDYISDYVITAEGIRRACLNIDLSEMRNFFIQVDNEILTDWVDNYLSTSDV